MRSNQAQAYLDTVRSRNPIEEVVGQDTELKREGTRLRGACPIHGDSNPSLVIYPESQSWHCYGCDKGGDVFAWMQARNGVDFWAAVDLLAERKGIERRQVSQAERQQLEALQTERRALREILTEAARFYASQLWQPLGKQAREYLAGRGFSEATLKSFNIGYAAGGTALQGHLRSKSYADELIDKAGLLGRPRPSDGLRQDFFWQRVIFPVYDGGSVSNLYGRAVDPDGKPAHLYLSGKNSGLFNWDEASRHREVFLTEGIIDALSLHQAGFGNVIASYGTAGFREEFGLRLKRAGVEKVYLTFDSDAEADEQGKPKKSGQAAALKVASQLAGLGIEPRIVDLGPKDDPQSKLDPNDYFRTSTANDFHVLVAAAKTPPDYKLLWKLDSKEPLFEVRGAQLLYRSGPREYLVQTLTIENPENKGLRASVVLMCNGVLVHKDRVSFSLARSRTGFAKKATGQSPAEVEADLLRIDGELVAWALSQETAKEAAAANEAEMSDDEREEALAFLRDPDLLQRIVEDLDKLGYVGEDSNKVMVYLIATSRKLRKPLAAVVKGQSAAGKSDLVKKVIELMPPEDVYDLSRTTPQALYHMPKEALKHKFVSIMERIGAEQADYAIRTMQSEQVLRLLLPIKDPSTGQMTSTVKEVEGPMAYIETTTQPQINNENATRMFDLYINESPEQTKRIHDKQRYSRTEEAFLSEAEHRAIVRKHRNAQRLLKPYHRVAIPYAEDLEFPSDHVRMRRDNARYLDLIESIAFLHQYQREIRRLASDPEVEYVITHDTDPDHDLARLFSDEILAQTLDELPKPTRALLVEIKSMVEEMARQRSVRDASKIEFTRRDIRKYTGASITHVQRHTELLADMGYLDCSGGGSGRTVKYTYVHEGDVTRPKLKGLLTPEEFHRKRAAGQAHSQLAEPSLAGDGGSK